jgi:type VI secretion system protein ImpK
MASNQAPFDSDKTLIKPLNKLSNTPKIPPFKVVARSGASQASLNQPHIANLSSFDQSAKGENPLIEAAFPILREIINLRIGEEGDIEVLRKTFQAEIKAFEVKALANYFDRTQVLAARYVLCSALDESVTMSGIENNAEWAKEALLSTFHEETWGGEKSFLILERCMQQPSQSLYLLELIYVLISLGFEGRYRVMDRGLIALEALRDKVYHEIKEFRGEALPDLAKPILRIKTKNPIHKYLPLWLVIIIAIIILAFSFFGFYYTLNNRASEVFKKYDISNTYKSQNTTVINDNNDKKNNGHIW